MSIYLFTKDSLAKERAFSDIKKKSINLYRPYVELFFRYFYILIL